MIGTQQRDLRAYMLGGPRGRSHPGVVYYNGLPITDPAPPQRYRPGAAPIPTEQERTDDDD